MPPQPMTDAQTASADAPANFAARGPSQTWERVECAPYFFWVWFKPAHLPTGLVMRVPDEAYQAHPLVAQWTLRRMSHAAGVDTAIVGTWHLYGASYVGMNGTNPYLDAPIPPPPPGVDPSIVVDMQPAPVAPSFAPPLGAAPFAPAFAPPAGAPNIAHPMLAPGFAPPMISDFVMPAAQGPLAMPQRAAPGSIASTDPNLKESFECMETDWQAAVEIEKDLGRLRKQFMDLIGRMKTLNRDLNSDERRCSDNQDKKDWLDARRGLRDGSLRLWRCIKELDMGDMSFAGRKQSLQQIYEQFVLPRIPFEGVPQARREFEQQRKLVTTLQSNMNTAYNIASIEGERRASQILARIAQKVREESNRKNFLGMMLD
jgi:hypothetical protein